MNELDKMLRASALSASESRAFHSRMELFVMEMQRELKRQADELDDVKATIGLDGVASLKREVTLIVKTPDLSVEMKFFISQEAARSYRLTSADFDQTFNHPKSAMAALLDHTAESRQKWAQTLEAGAPR